MKSTTVTKHIKTTSKQKYFFALMEFIVYLEIDIKSRHNFKTYIIVIKRE